MPYLMASKQHENYMHNTYSLSNPPLQLCQPNVSFLKDKEQRVLTVFESQLHIMNLSATETPPPSPTKIKYL